MYTRWKSHTSELMLLYGHPVAPGMTQACGVFNNPHAVDSIVAGFSVTVPNQSIFYSQQYEENVAIELIYSRMMHIFSTMSKSLHSLI